MVNFVKAINILIVFFSSFLMFSCGTKETSLFAFRSMNAKTGLYGKNEFNKDWNNPKWEHGISQGLVYIVEGGDPSHQKALRVLFPKGSYSNSSVPGKIQWIVDLAKGFNEIYFSYDIKFDKDFDFVKGGKIHGLAGGKRNSGGNKPNGLDGWSSRVIWFSQGKLGQYVYHPDQPSNYGEIFKYTINGEDVVAEKGKWYRIVNRVAMNTPKKRDGVVQAWVDDQLVLDIRNLRFRDTDSMNIDTFYFTTFFGGDGEEWAAVKDEFIYFDNFRISTVPITGH